MTTIPLLPGSPRGGCCHRITCCLSFVIFCVYLQPPGEYSSSSGFKVDGRVPLRGLSLTLKLLSCGYFSCFSLQVLVITCAQCCPRLCSDSSPSPSVVSALDDLHSHFSVESGWHQYARSWQHLPSPHQERPLLQELLLHAAVNALVLQ